MMKYVIVLSLAAVLAAAWRLSSTPVSAAKDPVLALPVLHGLTPDNPVELGDVHWLRDLDAGKTEAQKNGKPLLILFQEVPGCSNCTRYGSGTLRHPLIVEAIETYFVPVCIYNNKDGKDAEALKMFNEPAWNNPVVRITRADYQDMVPRMANFGSSKQLVAGMRRALGVFGTAPRYLELLEEELDALESGTESATFSMHCFWTGESVFGSLPGVIETQAGFQDGKEVVRVTYNPDKTSKAALETATRPKDFSACSVNNDFRADREPKYYLAQTLYKYVPMTQLQAARANSLIGQGKSPDPVLSPRQIALARRIEENPGKKWENAINADNLAEAWAKTVIL